MAKAIDRIFSIIQSLGMSARQFDMSIGASNGYTLRMKKNNASVGSDILERIVEKYPFVNINWVVTGHGTMFGTDSSSSSSSDIAQDKRLTYKEVEAIIEQKIKAHQEQELKNLMDQIKKEIATTKKEME
ncbi:hypothetical protein OSR52_05405 [Galbibacter sp. CMA-7]|uniref:XRE family transcriptional regulator n=2 Tax=Galbibacter pacificus TaxID=2996052 RepID=A0ABT6FPX4_9FLAO|nr:hypothetical protein [Galbibacter pacificus]MDG3582226.1 hypothetical protein [Galbibacter pacificus]MDG3585298.1 hypothetical protein [Galbibacter pacificus]